MNAPYDARSRRHAVEWLMPSISAQRLILPGGREDRRRYPTA